MGSDRGSLAGRARWVTTFAALLLLCSMPVLAAGEGPAKNQVDESTEFTPPTAGEEAIAEAQIPDAEDVSKALGEYEREEAEHREWLASREAIEQREASRLAFANLTAAESQNLLRTLFAAQLEALDSDPSRYLSEARLIRDPAGAGAVVEDEDEGSLLESSVPVRTEDKDGDVAKVDLSLEPTPRGYETANALTDLQLPDSASSRIAVGSEGFKISQANTADSAAQRLGDTDLFYPEVLPDTDLLIAPTSSGVELLDLLRSEDSPESFRFEIEVPDGTQLRPDGRGGAEVVREGETLNRIPKPWAIDAQQTDVPLQTDIEGNSLVVSLSHREADYAYPILLDPIVEDWVNQGENWYNGYNWGALSNGAWQWTSNNGNILHDICCWEGSHAGLLTIVQDAFYGPEQYGQWSYSTANENVYIHHAWLIPFNRADNGCGSAQPHDYTGLWNPGSEDWIPHLSNYAKNYGNVSFDGYGKALVIGEGTGPPGVWLACDRVLYSGGVGIWLNDDWGPGISYAGVPSGGWIGDKEKSTIEVDSWDEGLGVQFVKVRPEGKPVAQTDNPNSCTGLYGARCPTEHTSHFEMTGDSLGPGIRTGSVTVSDPTGKTAENFFTTKVDNSVPEVALEGQLAKATGEEVGYGDPENPVGEGEDELSLPVYNLQIKAKDGSLESNLTKRSGVKKIAIHLDENPTPLQSWTQSCPNSSCSMEKTYPLQLSEIDTAGAHKLEVKVEDFVGEVKVRKIDFEYFPATGMKDDYVMHYFPLPDGQGNEEEEHPARPELAVNVMNGNLVYRERDIDVEGPAVDLELERYYNSQLPAEADTEWGEGWNLAQTPELKPAQGAEPSEAELLESSGALEEDVELPMAAEEEKFDPELQATLTKKASGGYELTDETGEEATSVVFDETGQAEARLTEGHAKIDYSYEGGELAQIAVQDPGSAGNPTEPPQEEEPEEAGETPVYSSAFGSNGSGDGQLKSPGDVAIDTQGDIWVADKANNRIQQFSPEGQFISKFGTYGSANGQLNIPTSLTIDAAGNVLVTERGNDRVQKFSPAGEYLDKFGSYGTGNGQFNGPEGIAIDAEGDIWVADTYSGRVQEFDSEGNFLQVVGSKGSGEGQIGEPTGIDIDPSGNLWVADWQNNRVEVFDSEGGFLDQFGSQGTGEGQFNRPDALDIDDAGNVWVGDQNNDRVQRFDLAAQYIDQFGEGGSGEGQFNFAYPMGLEAKDGHIWVADVNNHRIQEWVMPGAKELFTAHGQSVGSQGSEPGELSSPADVAVDEQGGLWIADRGNDRIQHFDSEGSFLSQFGSTGSGDGQLSEPAGIDLDPEGNIWVADTGNDRIQKFDPAGEFLQKFGSTGSENGQFDEPVGIAYAPDLLGVGALYVADRGNHRIQLFGKGGAHWGQAGSYGSGEKQLIEPSAIALGGPHGESEFTLLIADSGNHRIQRWTWNATFVNQFGTLGTDKGQLNRPEAVDVDEQGTVWVGDRVNDRVEAFDEDGKSLGEFGSQGSGEAQLELTYPIGIAATEGEVWLTDSGNHRLQRWLGFMVASGGEEAPLPEDDPTVDVQTPGGLVASVEGEEAGSHEYAHEGDLLTSHDGPEGETAYEYDEADRLAKVTLPNGTWGEIEYYADGRVKEVTVDPAGEAPATSSHFTYKDDSPRRTTVEPSDAPHVVYDIGDDGSVLKWWNTQQPPELDLGGNLYDNRNEDGALWPGLYLLEVEALSEEGVASVEVIVGGDILVDEMSCEQDLEVEGKECKKVINEWVLETDQNAPGHLQVEVVATDSIGESTAERFWVDIPEPPPPLASGTPVEPRYRDIAKFREEYGLEVVFPVANETELNERIFNLIKAWGEPNTPAGKVARETTNRWGVPLRPDDVAELDYREWLYDVNAEKIDEWVEATNPGSYAGYYLDHAGGGVMHIGFLGNQEEQLSSLETSLSLVGGDRLSVYPTPPTVPYTSVRATTQSVMDAIDSNSTLADLVISVEDDESGKATRIGTPNVAQVESILDEMVGANAPVVVEYEAGGGALLAGRYRNKGRMRAGDYINSDGFFFEGIPTGGPCTAGFGAKDKRPRSNGGGLTRLFLLTAGHCAVRTGEEVWRNKYDGDFEFPFASAGKSEVGRVTRNAFQYVDPGGVRTDGAVIWIRQGGIVPRDIWAWDGHALPTKPPRKARKRNVVCYSGALSKNVACGKIVARSINHRGTGGGASTGVAGYWVKFPKGRRPVDGDSGSPVWNRRTGASIGLVSVGRPPDTFEETLVAPLLHPPNMPANRVPGILHHFAMEPLRLKLGG